MKIPFKLLKIIVIVKLMTMVIYVKGQGLPIKPTRTISFETTEGSYMDVDICPDGKTIVFDLLGDLYTMPATGGAAVQITHGLAFNRLPVWAPSGKQIAFISDISGAKHLNVINRNGTEQRTLGSTFAQLDYRSPHILSEMPAWTPDGDYISFNHLLYSLAGGNLYLPSPIELSVQFSKNGHFLYYDDNKLPRSFCRYDRYTGQVTKLSSLPKGTPNPHISPDGEWLSYIIMHDSTSDLYARNLIDNTEKLLVSSIERHHREFNERYSFTPDSHGILIGFGGKLHLIDVGSGDNKIIPFVANVKADCGSLNYNEYKLRFDSLQVKYTRSANASTDGKSLVFSALNRIYVMNLSSGISNQLVDQPASQVQPIYSPDGKWIAYVTWDDCKGGQVWRVSSLGGKPEQLTRLAGYYTHPCWSPRGDKIAVLRDSLPAQDHDYRYVSSLGDLLLINLIDRTVNKITDSIPVWNNLSFSAEGTSLQYISGTNNSSKLQPIIVSIQLDGKNKNIIAAKSNNNDPLVNCGFGLKDVTISPDRRYVVYSINEDLYIEPLLSLGGPAILNAKTGLTPTICFAKGGIDPHWELGGKVLTWSFGNQFFRVNTNEIIQTAIDSASKGKIGMYDSGFFTIYLTPKQIFKINVTAPRSYAHGTIAFIHARIISMKGDEVIENGTVVVKDGKFVAVGRYSSIQIPVHAKIINISGKTIIPGLIDMHDHMNEPTEIFPNQHWKYLANLSYGVTTARDPSSSFDSFGYAELLETGQMIGPRLFTVGVAASSALFDLKSLDDARSIVNKRALFGAVAIKQYQLDTRLQKQWLLLASCEAGLNMTNEGDYDVKGSLAMIKDGSTGVEHNAIWGNVYNDVITFIAQSKTWLTPTLQVRAERENAMPYFDNFYRHSLQPKVPKFWPDEEGERLNKTPLPSDTIDSEFVELSTVDAAIRHNGGHVTMGAHGNQPGIGSHFELWALQMGGLSNMEALQAATIECSKGLGMQNDLGSIEIGKLADLIILDKNPLEDIHNTLSIKCVMKDGIIYDGNTLDEQWPTKKKLPEWR